MPGFISMNIHKSFDETRVVNYTQWESEETFQAMLQNEDAKQYVAKVRSIAVKSDPNLYEVSYIDHR
jgi:heme-degrading monooxygenase HmoA